MPPPDENKVAMIRYTGTVHTVESPDCHTKQNGVKRRSELHFSRVSGDFSAIPGPLPALREKRPPREATYDKDSGFLSQQDEVNISRTHQT